MPRSCDGYIEKVLLALATPSICPVNMNDAVDIPGNAFGQCSVAKVEETLKVAHDRIRHSQCGRVWLPFFVILRRREERRVSSEESSQKEAKGEREREKDLGIQ